MESKETHEILAINFTKSTGIFWDPSDFGNQISSNPMEFYGIHEILAAKSHQIQWNLMGPMRFQQSNLIKPNGTLWDP